MADLAQILEEELEEAVEVKNKKSLHRYIILLTENMVRKEENRMEHTIFQQELLKIDGRFNQLIIELREGFKRVDQRFEASDKRFEAIENRLDKLGQHIFRFMIWSFGTTVTAAGIIIAVLKLT